MSFSCPPLLVPAVVAPASVPPAVAAAGVRGRPRAGVHRGEAFMRARETVRLAAIIILLLPAALVAQRSSSSISAPLKDSAALPLPGILARARKVRTTFA